MAACTGSLQHIFDKPLPENPTLLESLSSWNQINSKPIEDSSFTEIFGELHFKENNPESSPSSSFSSSSSSSSSLTYLNSQSRGKIDSSSNNDGSTKSSSSLSEYFSSSHRKQYQKNSESFSSMNSESLQLCTEGLGFESSDDVEDLKTDMNGDWKTLEERISIVPKHTPIENNLSCELRRSRTSGGSGGGGGGGGGGGSGGGGGGGAFPPPISCIGESGKPWVCFKSYRQDGRFVLKEIRIPTQEFLHASREDGRLKLQFFKSDEEIIEEDENEDEDEEDDDDDESDEIDGENDAQIISNEGGDHR